jgi:hypothetical protein
MMIRHTALLITFLFGMFIGCKKDSSPTQAQTTPATQITKSPKRGLAYNLYYTPDFDTLKSGVSWWYNWSYSTSAPTNYYKTYTMEFIPMLWGGNTSDNDINMVESFILGHPEVKYLLVMNEPNLTDQANRLPYQAAADWVKYEKVVSDMAAKQRTIYLVGPAMNWGTLSGYSDPVKWLDDFYTAYRTAYNKDPRIDYLAFHWYDYGLASQLDRLKKYGKQIWITEMANWNSQINSYEKQKAQMTDMVNTCETRTDVFRYAWFIGRGTYPDAKHTYLFNATPGELNDLGKLYISLPYSK